MQVITVFCFCYPKKIGHLRNGQIYLKSGKPTPRIFSEKLPGANGAALIEDRLYDLPRRNLESLYSQISVFFIARSDTNKKDKQILIILKYRSFFCVQLCNLSFFELSFSKKG